MNYPSSNCVYIKRPSRGKCVHLINIRETNSAKIGFTFLFYVSCNVSFVTCLQKKNSDKYDQTLYLLSGQGSSTHLAEIVLSYHWLSGLIACKSTNTYNRLIISYHVKGEENGCAPVADNVKTGNKRKGSLSLALRVRRSLSTRS